MPVSYQQSVIVTCFVIQAFQAMSFLCKLSHTCAFRNIRGIRIHRCSDFVSVCPLWGSMPVTSEKWYLIGGAIFKGTFKFS